MLAVRPQMKAISMTGKEKLDYEGKITRGWDSRVGGSYVEIHSAEKAPPSMLAFVAKTILLGGVFGYGAGRNSQPLNIVLMLLSGIPLVYGVARIGYKLIKEPASPLDPVAKNLERLCCKLLDSGKEIGKS